MKKIMITAVIVLGSFFAPVGATTLEPMSFDLCMTEETWKEIPLEKLPQAVQDAFKADFKTATLNKAFSNEKQEYKLEFTIDGAASTVYADKNGNWIDKKK